jgi:hypothetical protein
VIEFVVVGVHVFADRSGYIGTAGYGEGTPLAEVVLDINNDQGAGHQFSS